jgi:curved DNA-binding protein CbpA
MWSVGMRDPYESLAVPRSATAADIKRSFRELAKRLHPDANNGDPKAATLFAELNAAYEILADEEKRRAFDQGKIDAEGKPKRRALVRQSQPSMSHIVTRLMVVMVMLFITATLIMRGLSPDTGINATSENASTVSSAVAAKVDTVPGPQPERPAAEAQPTPRLILQQSVSQAAADDSMRLGIQVSGQADNLALEINGLPSGTTISSGRQLGGGGWRILAADVGTATIKPPPGFSGTIDLTVELRLIDDTVVDHGSLHFQWLDKPTVAAKPIESANTTPASENPVAKSTPTPPPRDQNAVQDATNSHPDHESIDILIGQSEKLIAAGNVEAARSLLQPVAESHDARAALVLGSTYDPIVLANLQEHGVAADVSLALGWYKKAQEFGSVEAQGRLKLLSARAAEPKKHVFHRPPPVQTPKQAPIGPSDPNGVYVAGTRVGSDPDPNIRLQLLRDDAGRQLRTTPGGAADDQR